MLNKIILIFSAILVMFYLSNKVKHERVFISIMPGQGIKIGNVSFVFGKTLISDTKRFYKISKLYAYPSPTLWDGHTKAGKDTGGVYWNVGFRFGPIVYHFTSLEYDTQYTLHNIRIIFIKNMNIMYRDHDLTKPNVKIMEIFPIKNKYDYMTEDSLRYSLSYYGLEIEQEKVGRDFFINNILIE